jgi:hypothetical protein
MSRATRQKDIELSVQCERHYRHFSAWIRLCETADDRSAAANLRHRYPTQRFGKQRNRVLNCRIPFDVGLSACRTDGDFIFGLRYLIQTGAPHDVEQQR